MTERYYRKTAAIVGALFIIATAASLATVPFLGSALDGHDFILKISENENGVMMASMLMIILATSLVGIGALMFPVLRKDFEGLGMAYTGIRFVEGIFIVLSSVCLLGMVTMGQDYAAGRLDQASSQSMGALLISIRDWSLMFGTLFFLSLGGLVLNYVLYRSRLVPRWLSAWGLVGDVGILIYGVMGLFGTDTNVFDIASLLAAPIAVQEMVFASWLIIKGFNTPTRSMDKLQKADESVDALSNA
jgi:hypothetical protein